MTRAHIQAAQPLAKSGEALKAGPIGLAVILLLCIACYFLFKSMSKHLRTVREQFPEEPAPPRRPGPPPLLSRAEFAHTQAARAVVIAPGREQNAIDPMPQDPMPQDPMQHPAAEPSAGPDATAGPDGTANSAAPVED